MMQSPPSPSRPAGPFVRWVDRTGLPRPLVASMLLVVTAVLNCLALGGWQLRLIDFSRRGVDAWLFSVGAWSQGDEPSAAWLGRPAWEAEAFTRASRGAARAMPPAQFVSGLE